MLVYLESQHQEQNQWHDEYLTLVVRNQEPHQEQHQRILLLMA